MMADVFGGLAGGPGDGGGAPRSSDLSALDDAFDGAAVWGLELDPKFRVLAATLEPTVDRDPWSSRMDGTSTNGDRRIQLLCHPVSTILGSLRQEASDGRQLLEFGDDQLVDVVAAFDGAQVRAPLFDRPEPRPGTWGPRFSLEGRSTAPDGTRHTLTLRLEHADLTLDLFARFDEVEVKGPSGESLVVPN